MLNRYTLILAALCILLSVGLLRVWQSRQAKDRTIASMSKNLQITTNALGEKVTTINLLQADRKELLKMKFETKDSVSKKLQSVVKSDKNIVAATVFGVVTESKVPVAAAVDPIKSYIPKETPKKLKLVSKIKGKGFEMDIEADLDSIRLMKYKIFSEYTIAQTTRRKGWFGRKETIIQITPSDTASTVIDARSFTVEQKRKGTGWKILGGILTGYILAKSL